MITSFTAARQRVLAVLGSLSMYRLVLFALIALAVIAFVLSLFGVIVSPTPLELVASFLVLALVISVVDAVAQRILRLPWRIESSVVTALILLFVLRPGVEPSALVGLAIAGAVASVSKYLIAWRGRHIFNPAAFGAAVVSILGAFGAFEWLGTSSAWWVGTPVLTIPVAVLGLLVLWRTEKIRVVLVFLIVAVATSVVRQAVQAVEFDVAFDVVTALQFAVLQSPFLFLGAFMLSEPLTLPPRRRQQLVVAVVVGLLAGWPLSVAGLFTLGQERALLIGNLVAFAFALRGSVRLVLERREFVTPTAQELTFPRQGPCAFPPWSVSRARRAAPPPRRARHPPGVQHRVGAGRPAHAAHRLQERRPEAPLQLQAGSRGRRAGGDLRRDRDLGRLHPCRGANSRCSWWRQVSA
ncbi:hypothetical protein JM654_01725 [Microbacterium oxydans]|nr:hypothetical protein [Microbacterium oxydans]